MNPFFAFIRGQLKTKLRTRQYRKWRDDSQ
jgi:hypothetical protein